MSYVYYFKTIDFNLKAMRESNLILKEETNGEFTTITVKSCVDFWFS